MKNIQCALAISVRQGRSRITIPFPNLMAFCASRSFLLKSARAFEEIDLMGPRTHSKLAECKRHASAVPLDLDKYETELTEDLCHLFLEIPVAVVLWEARGWSAQMAACLTSKTLGLDCRSDLLGNKHARRPGVDCLWIYSEASVLVRRDL